MANLITISRIPLLIGYLLMLYFGSPPLKVVAVPLLFVLIMMDTLDGWVARRTGQASLTGSVLDIAADRIYELVLWVVFADLDLIPIAIPIIVVIRTTLTDALRSLGVKEGKPPFQQHRTRLGTFLVASPWMRSSYSVSKIVSFCGLSLVVAFSAYPAGSAVHALAPKLLPIFQFTSWIAVLLCVVRGSPVVVGSIVRSLASASRDS